MALLDSVRNAPRPHKAVLGGLAVGVLAALGYFGLIAPKQLEHSAARTLHESTEREVQKARAEEASLRPFRLQAEALRKRLETARARLPNEKEMPVLYRQLTDLAQQSGLAIALFQPKGPEERDVVAEVPIAFTSEGTFHQFGGFFSRVGQLSRIVTLNDFKMSGVDRPTGTVRGELTLATYVFRPDGAPAAGPKPAAGAPAPLAGSVPPAPPAPQRSGS
jgi:Tfp pilus assembly protein PilO